MPACGKLDCVSQELDLSAGDAARIIIKFCMSKGLPAKRGLSSKSIFITVETPAAYKMLSCDS